MLRTLRRLLLALYGALALLVVLFLLTPPPVPSAFLPASTLVMLAFALLHAGARYGWGRALLFWGVTSILTLGFEALGVSTGWIYGPYHYTARLGPRFLGLVPYQIPLAWFMMLYPATVVAERALPAGWPEHRKRWVLPLLAGLAMTAWDLVMDPFMAGGRYWVWEVEGAYFGVPVHNFGGWWLTATVAVAVFLGLGRVSRPRAHPDDREAVVAYALVALGNVAHAALLGYWGPALVGFFALVPWVWLGWWGAGSG